MIEKLAGMGLIAGCVLFMIAAFTPLTFRVITADVAQRIALIENERTGWVLLNLLFGAGSVLAAAGLALFILHVQSLQDNPAVSIAAYAGVMTAVLGTLCWVSIVHNRSVLPPQELGSSLSVNTWIFPSYTLLTQAALVLVGFVLLQSGYPSWLSAGTLVYAGLSILAYLVFKDVPPFVHYVPLLVIGITLVR